MRENVLEAAEVSGEREDQAVARSFSDSARAFSEIAGDVVLPELGAGGEEDDRLLLAELVVEDLRQPGVGALGHSRRVHRAGALLRVVVDEKVLRLDHPPVEVLVLHLIHAEVLLRVEASRAQQGGHRGQHSRHFHFALLLWFQRHCFRVAPQPLYLVERPQCRMEDVNYEIEEIEQHPAALL